MREYPYSGIRGSITQYVRLASRINPIHLSVEVKTQQLESYRLHQENITYTPILMKIIATAAKKYPVMNGIVARPFLRKKLFIPETVDISVAMEKSYKGECFVAIPVVRSVNEKTINDIASEINRLATLPYEKLPDIGPVLFFHKLPDFWKYWSLKLLCRFPSAFQLFFGTIGFTNLGKYGVQTFSPVWVNTIVFGIGAIEEKPVVVNGTIKAVPVLHLSMSFNHSVLDGATAAAILSEVRDLIERCDYAAL